jgi:hypothetical protein
LRPTKSKNLLPFLAGTGILSVEKLINICMPYNNDFNRISKSYTSLKENEAAMKMLFENFDITEEEFKNAPLISTIEEMNTLLEKRGDISCSVSINESNGKDTSVVTLKYLAQGEDIV